METDSTKFAAFIGTVLVASGIWYTFWKQEETPFYKVQVLLPHQEERWPKIDELLSRKIENLSQLTEVFITINPEATELGFFSKYLEQPEKEAEKIEFYESLLPFIQNLARRLPDLFPKPIYHLIPQQIDHVSLTREQVACVLANGFFSTFTEPSIRDLKTPHGEKLLFQAFNFLTLFKCGLGRATLGTIQCIFNYFRSLKIYMRLGNVVIYRQHLTTNFFPKWTNSDKKICKVTVRTSGSIEDDLTAEFHADFANKYIGGGALYGGYAQEEILFAFRTECIISMLLCPVTEPNEAIIIAGPERFSSHEGYAQSFQYAGPYQDDLGDFPPTTSKAINIVAVDAMAAVGNSQYYKENIERELNKLYCGIHNWRKYSFADTQTYATGHWGCGICGGNKQLKAIQQIVSVSEVGGLDVNYYTWGQPKFASKLVSLVRFLHDSNSTVGDVTRVLFTYYQTLTEGHSPFEYLLNQLKK